jgi:hypothetical protein
MKRYIRYNKNDRFDPKGVSERGYTWEVNTPKKCESCGKKTTDLYCTPIGAHNWRCRDCQIGLIESIGYEVCLENEDNYFSYPIIPMGYVSPNYKPHKKHWWNK